MHCSPLARKLGFTSEKKIMFSSVAMEVLTFEYRQLSENYMICNASNIIVEESVHIERNLTNGTLIF